MKRKNIGLLAILLVLMSIVPVFGGEETESDVIEQISITEESIIKEVDIVEDANVEESNGPIDTGTQEAIAEKEVIAENVPAYIKVISPNGGENWVIGTTKTIKWSSSGAGANVKIELLKGGVVNKVIAGSTPNDGSHNWAIPGGQTLGNDYKVRITSISKPSIKDTSDYNFIISSGYGSAKIYTNKKTYTQIPVEIVQLTTQSIGTSPVWIKQKEPWKIVNVVTGKTIHIPICVSYGYGSCASKKLNPSEKITKGWNQKDSSGNLIPPGTYVASVKYYKKDPNSGSPTAYIVNTMFTIVQKGSLVVNIPNGGEIWSRGTTKTIKWTSIGNVGTNVKIELLKGGVVNKVIIGSTPNDGSFGWSIPAGQTVGADYKIRVTSTSNSVYKDVSNNNFKIL